MRLGVFEGIFTAGLDLATCFRLAGSSGFEGVELTMTSHESLLPEARNETTAGIAAIERSIGLDNPRPDALHLASTDAEIERLRREAVAAGVSIPSVSTMQLFYYPLSSPLPAVRDRAIHIVRRMLEATALLGGDVILVPPGMVTQSVPYQDAWARSQDALSGLVPYAEQLGVTMAIENVWNKFLLSPLEFRDFIDSFHSPFVAAYFDVANVLRYGFPEQWIELLGHRLRRVHFKDYDLAVDNICAFTHLLHGDVPWPSVVRSLEAIAYDGWVVAEVTPYREHREQALTDTAAALKRILRADCQARTSAE